MSCPPLRDEVYTADRLDAAEYDVEFHSYDGSLNDARGR
jgi:hypothetical protein